MLAVIPVCLEWTVMSHEYSAIMCSVYLCVLQLVHGPRSLCIRKGKAKPPHGDLSLKSVVLYLCVHAYVLVCVRVCVHMCVRTHYLLTSHACVFVCVCAGGCVCVHIIIFKIKCYCQMLFVWSYLLSLHLCPHLGQRGVMSASSERGTLGLQPCHTVAPVLLSVRASAGREARVREHDLRRGSGTVHSSGPRHYLQLADAVHSFHFPHQSTHNTT